MFDVPIKTYAEIIRRKECGFKTNFHPQILLAGFLGAIILSKGVVGLEVEQ